MFMLNLGNPLSSRQLLSLTLASSLSISYCLMIPVADAAAKKSATPPSIQSTNGKTNSYVEVALGKSRVIQLNSAANRVSVSNPDMLGIVVISPTEIQIIGRAVGNCSILVWSEASGKNYLNIDVSVNQDVATLSQKIKAIDSGIQVIPLAAKNTVILTGYAESKEKAQLVIDLARAFFETGDKLSSSSSAGSAGGSISSTTNIINMIHVPGQASTKNDMVQERLREINPNIVLTVVPGSDGATEKAMLTGRVKTSLEVSKAINVTSVFYGTPGIKIITGPGGSTPSGSSATDTGGFGAGGNTNLIGNLDKNILQGSIITDSSGNVISMMQIEERPQIRCHIQMLEVSKTVNFSSGFNAFSQGRKIAGASSNEAGGSLRLPSIAETGQLLLSNGGQLGYRFGTDLAAYVQGLIVDNKARVLAEPNIITMSGEPATFLAGGEFPIPSVSSTGQVSILFKEFGVRLNILPTLTERDSIHMQVSPEVSSLDATAGVTLGGSIVPGLRTRRSQAVVEMGDGENFVLSGLYSENMNKNIQKTPLLGQIPILGELFRSRAYTNNKTELVIIIRPEVIKTSDTSYTPTLPPLSSNTEAAPAYVSHVISSGSVPPAPDAQSPDEIQAPPQAVTAISPEITVKKEIIVPKTLQTHSIMEEASTAPYGLGPKPEWITDKPSAKVSETPIQKAVTAAPKTAQVEAPTTPKVASKKTAPTLLNLTGSTISVASPPKNVSVSVEKQTVAKPVIQAENQKTASLLDAPPEALKKHEITPPVTLTEDITLREIPRQKQVSVASVIIPAATPAIVKTETQRTTSLLDAVLPEKPEQRTQSLLDENSLVPKPMTKVSDNATKPNTPASINKAIESALDSAFSGPKPEEATKPNVPKNNATPNSTQKTVSLVEAQYPSSEQHTQSLLPENEMMPTVKKQSLPRLLEETVDSVLESLERQRQDEFEASIKPAFDRSALGKKPRNQ